MALRQVWIVTVAYAGLPCIVLVLHRSTIRITLSEIIKSCRPIDTGFFLDRSHAAKAIRTLQAIQCGSKRPGGYSRHTIWIRTVEADLKPPNV